MMIAAAQIAHQPAAVCGVTHRGARKKRYWENHENCKRALPMFFRAEKVTLPAR
jgi:hypothetical protein